MKKHLILAVAALAFSAPALAAGPAPASSAPREAVIPMADHNGIDDFQAFDEQSIFLHARDGQWYHATMVGFCPGLDKKPRLAYETNSDGSFDRTSTLRVNGNRCQVDSLVESGPPPSKQNRAKG